MAMLKYEFKDATPERKQEMLSEIIKKYDIGNKNELVQALGHAQAVLDCSQEDFSSAVNISSRQLRNHKRDYLDLYTASFERYNTASDSLVDVDAVIDEDVMEQVYENLLSRLKSPKTATKDIVTLTEYFGITKEEFKRYTDFRNATMRAFISDNLAQIVQDEEAQLLVKSVVAESPYLYQGTEKTLGNTINAHNIDLDNPIVRLEAQTLGLLFMSLFNGSATPAFVEYAQTLRLLKLASETYSEKDMQKSHKDFDKMDGKTPKRKHVSEQELITALGEDEGREIYEMLSNMELKAKNTTAVNMPKYEDIEDDYLLHLKVFPELQAMPIKVLFAKLNAQQDRLKDKYSQYLEVNED